MKTLKDLFFKTFLKILILFHFIDISILTYTITFIPLIKKRLIQYILLITNMMEFKAIFFQKNLKVQSLFTDFIIKKSMIIHYLLEQMNSQKILDMLMKGQLDMCLAKIHWSSIFQKLEANKLSFIDFIMNLNLIIYYLPLLMICKKKMIIHQKRYLVFCLMPQLKVPNLYTNIIIHRSKDIIIQPIGVNMHLEKMDLNQKVFQDLPLLHPMQVYLQFIKCIIQIEIHIISLAKMTFHN